MNRKNKKRRIDIVYSTNPDFEYNYEEIEEESTLPPYKQTLYISVDRKQRKGKSVTLVSGFIGKREDLKELGRLLRTKCNAGGTVKEGDILIQGDFRGKVMQILNAAGYKTKSKG